MSNGGLNWTSGHLVILSQNVTVGTNGSLGASLNLSTGKVLEVEQTLTLVSGAMITASEGVSGSTLAANAVIQSGGSFNCSGNADIGGFGAYPSWGFNSYNLGGGTLSAGSLQIEGPFNFIGGTLAVPAVEIDQSGVFNLAANANPGFLVRDQSDIAMVYYGGPTRPELNLLPASSSSDRQLLIAPGLSIAGSAGAWQGRVDLSNNDLDVPGGR